MSDGHFDHVTKKTMLSNCTWTTWSDNQGQTEISDLRSISDFLWGARKTCLSFPQIKAEEIRCVFDDI